MNEDSCGWHSSQTAPDLNSNDPCHGIMSNQICMTEIHTGFSVSQGFYYLFIYIASPFVATKSSQLVDCAFVCQMKPLNATTKSSVRAWVNCVVTVICVKHPTAQTCTMRALSHAITIRQCPWAALQVKARLLDGRVQDYKYKTIFDYRSWQPVFFPLCVEADGSCFRTVLRWSESKSWRVVKNISRSRPRSMVA